MCFHSFLWHRLYVHLTQVIEKLHSVLEMVRAGVLWSEGSIQGSQPLSRYGDRAITILPSVLPAALLQAPGGLHRFEPVIWTGSLPPRAMLLTRQGISLP